MFVQIKDRFINPNNITYIEIADDDKAQRMGYEIFIYFTGGASTHFAYDTKSERNNVLNEFLKLAETLKMAEARYYTNR